MRIFFTVPVQDVQWLILLESIGYRNSFVFHQVVSICDRIACGVLDHVTFRYEKIILNM